MSSAGASPQYYGITTLVPAAWQALGFTHAVTRPEDNGDTQAYLCVCRSHADALTIVHNLNLYPSVVVTDEDYHPDRSDAVKQREFRRNAKVRP